VTQVIFQVEVTICRGNELLGGGHRSPRAFLVKYLFSDSQKKIKKFRKMFGRSSHFKTAFKTGVKETRRDKNDISDLSKKKIKKNGTSPLNQARETGCRYIGILVC